MWKWYKTTKEYSDYQAYLTVQKTVTKVIRTARRTLERKLAKNVKKNPRQFYSHLNKHTKSRVQIGPPLRKQVTRWLAHKGCVTTSMVSSLLCLRLRT